jgi:poly-beta-1,6-N-acetyl-D-glucosamine synthase
MTFDAVFIYLIIFLSLITASKYLIYVFSSPLYLLNKKKLLKHSKSLAKDELMDKIRISVVIPAWNEEVGVLNTVKSLIASGYKNLEIIVVNDGSTDRTDEIVKDYIKNNPLVENKQSLLYFSKPNGGKGSALNYGIQRSGGDIVVTMDADTVFDKEALFEVSRYFINPEIDAAVGNVKVANSKSILGIIQQIEYTVGFYFKRTHSVFNCEYIIGGAFGVFRRETFDKYGYFDTVNKTEDIELSTRLQSNGCKIIFIEDAIAYTEGPTTTGGLLKQRLRWKKGRLDTFYVHRNLFFSNDQKHNRFLTHYLLPITLFYELELILEPFITTFGIYYLYRTHDFRSLILWILFTGSINIAAFVFGSKKNSLIAFAFIPVYFILSYVLTFIEVYAMYESVRLILSKKDVAWQKWDRQGVTLSS